MDKQTILERYSSCEVIGAALQKNGRLLKRFIPPGSELEKVINSISTPEQARSFFPVSLLIDLFDIAVKYDLVAMLARGAASSLIAVMQELEGENTPVKAINALVSSFPKQHLGNPGTLEADILGSKRAAIRDATYSPCGYLISLIETAMTGYGAKDIFIVHRKENCRNNDAASCLYSLTWK